MRFQAAHGRLQLLERARERAHAPQIVRHLRAAVARAQVRLELAPRGGIERAVDQAAECRLRSVFATHGCLPAPFTRGSGWPPPAGGVAAEILTNLHARLVHLRFRRAFRDAEQRGDLAGARNPPRHAARTLRDTRAEPRDCALEVEAVGPQRARGRRRQRPLVVDRVGQLARLGLAPPQVIEALVHREPVNPGPHRRLSLEAVELPEDLDEDVLHQVFTIVEAAGQPARQVVNPARMQPVELFEGSGLVASGSGQSGRLLRASRHPACLDGTRRTQRCLQPGGFVCSDTLNTRPPDQCSVAACHRSPSAPNRSKRTRRLPVRVC